MQIRELERDLGVDLVERRPGEAMLTEIGAEVARRAADVLAVTRDLADFARHNNQALTGRLRLGIIPTVAPYILPRVLPLLQRRYPELRIELRETQTKILIEELTSGALDAVLLALPVNADEIETIPLFEDPFLLAVPASDPRPDTVRVTASDIEHERLILLEEGHCLRDQALAYCARVRRDAPASLGSTSLSTVMQMVANGYGITLVPHIAIDAKVHDERVKLLRFTSPEPGRTIGLAWRRSSPRKADFAMLGKLVVEAVSQGAREKRRQP
jgi:LysR family hydrogen peroxide-inducible transcriptional activator